MPEENKAVTCVRCKESRGSILIRSWEKDRCSAESITMYRARLKDLRGGIVLCFDGSSLFPIDEHFEVKNRVAVYTLSDTLVLLAEGDGTAYYDGGERKEKYIFICDTCMKEGFSGLKWLLLEKDFFDFQEKLQQLPKKYEKDVENLKEQYQKQLQKELKIRCDSYNQELEETKFAWENLQKALQTTT